jgi:hypothetical protein
LTAEMLKLTGRNGSVNVLSRSRARNTFFIAPPLAVEGLTPWAYSNNVARAAFLDTPTHTGGTEMKAVNFSFFAFF